jgi:competence protein ComGC
MNETPPPPPPPLNLQPPKNSPLAIWSLILGILSLTCFYILTAIPAVICGHMAMSRIKRSGGALTGNGLAIGGLVTGYLGIALTLLVIPLLAAIAIPNFVKARNTAQMNACINNLRIIEGAKEQWKLEYKKETTDIPTQADLSVYLRNGQFPTCPAGGVYKINSAGEPAACSIPGHQLP